MKIDQIQVTLVNASAQHKQAKMFATSIPIDPYFPPLPPLTIDKINLGSPDIDLQWEALTIPSSASDCLCNPPKCKITGTVEVPIEIWYLDQANIQYWVADIYSFEIRLLCNCTYKHHVHMHAMAKPEVVLYRFNEGYSELQTCIGLYLLIQFLSKGFLVVPSEGFCPLPPDCFNPVI